MSLVTLESSTNSSEDLATKCRRCLKAIVPKLACLPALDALVHQQLHEGVMKLVLEQVCRRAYGWESNIGNVASPKFLNELRHERCELCTPGAP